MILIVLLIMVVYYKYILVILIIIEIIILNLSVILFYRFGMVNLEIYLIYFLVFMVCERVLGVTLLVIVVRFLGNDLFYSFVIRKK